MKLDEILAGLRARLTRNKSGETFRSTTFLRLAEDSEEPVAVRTGNGRDSIILAPMRSLSVEGFEFPFSSPSKIAASLRLKVMPFGSAGSVELFPVITLRKGRAAEGIVWYASPAELNIPASGTVKVWPAPMPFVSCLAEFGGSGVTMWMDEKNICSILWQSNKPVLYRWHSNSGEDSAVKELAWYEAYCTARELNRGGSFVINGSAIEETDEDFAYIIAESVKICPWMKDVNLSRTALEGARDLERIVRVSTRAAVWLLVLGAGVLGAGLLRRYQVQSQIDALRTRSENYYRQTFDPSRTGRISNPVMLARDKIAELSGTSTVVHPLEEVLENLGDIFASAGNSDVTIDVIRYNSEGIDCTGTAPDQSAVLNFRRAWEERGNMAQVDNTQFVSGIGYRFDLRVRWQ